MSNKGEVTYEVRADYSNVENDLEQANKKVEESVKKSADKSVKIEKEKTDDIKKEINKVENASKKSASKVEKTWEESAKDIEDAFQKSTDDIEKNTDGIEKSMRDAFGNVSNVIKDSLSDAATGFGPVLGKVGELTEGLSGTAKAALGIGTALVGVGIAAVGTTTDMDVAMNDFIASTGKGTEETERYQKVLENIYKNNYGEDFQDISDAMELVTKNLGDMDDSALQSVTESAFVLRDTFEYDLSESTRAAKAMMEQFGISGDEAMNLIAAGAQNGLDYSGELLDSVSEYSAQFAKVGLDADDMFKIFQKGAETGAWNLDKVGDAIKEMSIRVINGSDTTKTGFETIGLNADEMAFKFAQGGESAKEAFQQTVEALASIEDPLAQDAAGVALFGTMWEDLGPEVVTALADIEDGAYATGEELNKIKDVKYDDLGSMLDGLKRNVELLLIPIGEALIPLLSILIESVLPVLTGILEPLADLFGALLEPILRVISIAIQPLIDIFVWLIENAINPLIDVISNFLLPIFTEVLNGIAGTITDVFGNAKKIFKEQIDFIKNVFTGNWKGAWENIKNIFKNIVSGFASIFKAPINAIIDLVNGFIKGINKIKVPDWVPGVGGKSIKLPTIPRLRIGMDYVPSDDFPALLHKGEAVLTAQENALYRSVGGFNGIINAISERGYQDARNNSTSTIIIHTHVDLDGKEIGNSVTPYIDNNLSENEELGRRGN